MFYSQIILAKKGPLAKVWLAAHGWGDKKLGGRPQIFATDIAASVDSIVHPAVPLALRVSGHLLWGVVRIYSKKVHYLLHDCHQAVLKLKLAFRNNNPAEKGILVIDMDDRRRRRKTTQTAEDVVPHFGEFNDEDGLVAVGAFAVPVAWNEMAMDQEDWMPAEQGEEDDEEDEDSANEAGFQAASPGVNRHLDMGDAVLQGRRGEEEWTAFDPDDDEMEDEEDRSKGEGSHVSDIEVTRAVNESVNSEALQSARASVLDQSSVDPPMSPGMGDDGGGFIPDDDSLMRNVDDGDALQTVPMSENSKEASLGLSASRDESMEHRHTSIGGLNVSNEDDEEGSKKRKSGSDEDEAPKRKKRRRKRQITISENLEISGSDMRKQLQDTSDIVRTDYVHPSTWVPGKKAVRGQHPNTERLYRVLGYERLFTRPSAGDDGHLAPELLELWTKHTAVVLGKPFPYELRDDDEEETEEARRGGVADEGSEEPLIEDDDPPMAMDDDEPPMPMDDDEGAFPPDDGFTHLPDEEEEEQDMAGMVDSPDSRNSLLSFSLVNDILGDDNDEDNPRQTLGSDELNVQKSKWHKHTVQVLSLLKSRMASNKAKPDDLSDSDEDEAPEKALQLSYNSLSHGCSRRTAVTVFLELLQLKTWDFVDLEQDENFGDITILPGVKFDEDAATKA